MARAIESTEAVEPILSAEDAFDVFDRQVRRLMHGMNGNEFVRRWESGEYADIADTPGNRHIIRLAMMIPGDQQRS